MRWLKTLAWMTVGAAAGGAGLVLAFAVLGVIFGGLAMFIPAIVYGTLLGGPLGASMGLGFARRRAVASASPARGHWAWWWAPAVALVASPFVLFEVGGLPPLLWWRVVATALLGGLCAMAFTLRRSHRPALLYLLWPIAFMTAWDHRYACWRALNADWCGHMCDDAADPKCGDDDFGR